MSEMSIVVANPGRVAAEVIAQAFAPPPPVDYLAWAEQNIVFTKRESQFPGPYNSTMFKYFNEILAALSPDDPCREVTLKKSAQLGGTVLANIFVGGSIDMDPGDILYVHPTESNAQRWSKTKLAPMLKNTTALRALFPMKNRDGHDSVLYKERKDGAGAIIIGGANSPASLSMITVERQVQDDVSKYEMNTAGDPEKQADSRSRGREFAKIFKISTPLVVPGCRITSNYEKGSQERLFVPCPHCGHMQVLEWENFLNNLNEEYPERSHFTCVEPDCGGVIEEYHRPHLIAGLEWRSENPAAKRFHRSFELWSAISLLQSFERMAREWLGAKGDPSSEQTFLNDTVGRAYQTKGEAPPWESLRDRAAASDYTRGVLPAGYLFVTVGVDCQGDRVEWQVVAFGRDFKRAVIEYGVFDGHISEKKPQEALSGLLKQKYRNAYGRLIGVDQLAIDGNAYTEDVWSWAKKHPASKVIMVRGVGAETAPLLVRVKKERNSQGKLLRYSRRFYNFAASVLKMGLYRNLAKTDPLERGFVALPRGLEDEYFRQLTAETRAPKRQKDGFVVYRWEKDPNQANEGLDTMLQAEVAAIKFGVRAMPDTVWDKYEAERDCSPAPAQGDMEDLLLPKTTLEQKPKPASDKSYQEKVDRWANRK